MTDASQGVTKAPNDNRGLDRPVIAPWEDPASEPIVEFAGISKQFGDFVAVDDVDLKIYPGEFFALLGPSGCGKTTLLRMLAGFETPSQGRLYLDGQDISGVPANLRPVNMMFQSYALFPHLSVEANIAFGLKRSRLAREIVAERTSQMLRLVQMERFAARKPDQLSGGQRQRVALARALAKNPKLLLLDEPLGALDAKLREQTQFELVNIQEELGTTFVIVTHDQEEAMTVATRIGLMRDGVLEQVDTPSEIYENPKTRFAADFIGDVNLIEGVADGAGAGGRGSATAFHSEAGHKLYSRREDGIQDRQKCWLAVRPEKIAISRSRPAKADNRLKGTVDDIGYVGNLSTYHVRLEDGMIVKAQEANRQRVANREITWNDTVWLSWSAGASKLLTI